MCPSSTSNNNCSAHFGAAQTLQQHTLSACFAISYRFENVRNQQREASGNNNNNNNNNNNTRFVERRGAIASEALADRSSQLARNTLRKHSDVIVFCLGPLMEAYTTWLIVNRKGMIPSPHSTLNRLGSWLPSHQILATLLQSHCCLIVRRCMCQSLDRSVSVNLYRQSWYEEMCGWVRTASRWTWLCRHCSEACSSTPASATVTVSRIFTSSSRQRYDTS